MSKTLKLFKIFGITIQLHYSWFIILLILTWSLATAFFPHYFIGYSTSMYWFMGFVSAILLFVSVLLHELSHSLVAKWRNIEVSSITLFFFGGVAGIKKEQMKPSSEFLMAIAGPIFSFVLAAIFFAINKSNINGIVSAITFYLYQLNFILAIFNLIPGFPLDGGRAFRAILYAYYKDLKKATRIASRIGKLFAIFLIIIGFVSFFNGLNGLWFILLGGFLYFIAGLSYDQVVLKDVLEDIIVKDIMIKKYKKVDPNLTFEKFIKKYAKYDEDVFVIQNKKFTGILDLKRVQPMPKEMQKRILLKQITMPLEQIRHLRIENTAYTAFKKFSEENLDILPVLNNKKKLIGIVTRRSINNRLIIEAKFNS
jgi:Zn-dependent protease